MLKPDELVLLTDALKPPSGFVMDVSVITTYSLDLKAMLLVPMTFAMHGADEIPRDPDIIALLDATQRHIGKSTVFCHPGGIHEPKQYNSLFTFLEDSIHQVKAHDDRGVFHPKIWAVRYRNDHSEIHHRFLVSSRNLTLDDARDTLLVLDEAPDGNIDPTPAADFVATLPDLPGVEVSKKRRNAIADLADTLRTVRLSAPAPFTAGRLLPLGLGEAGKWPFPDSADRILAISPFLNSDILTDIRGGADDARLISRAEELNQIGRRQTVGWETYVLNGATEGEMAEEPGSATVSFSGLHAKTTVLDLPGGTSMIVTGSANLTRAAWNDNIEFNAVLTGPTKECGIDAVLVDGGGLMGLANILEPFEPEMEEGKTDATRKIEFEIERFHRELALSKPHLNVLEAEEGQVTVQLLLKVPEDPPGTSRVRLLTIHKDRAQQLGDKLTWKVARKNATAFLAVQTTVKSGDDTITRSCCLLATVTGDVPNRPQLVLDELITDAEDELRYLALLLDTNAGASAFDVGTTISAGVAQGAEDRRPNEQTPVLFEPLMRAVTQDSQHLSGLVTRVQELQDRHERKSLKGSVFEDFGPMWDAVKNIVAEQEQTP